VLVETRLRGLTWVSCGRLVFVEQSAKDASASDLVGLDGEQDHVRIVMRRSG
jgi:hypothetical protein